MRPSFLLPGGVQATSLVSSQPVMEAHTADKVDETLATSPAHDAIGDMTLADIGRKALREDGRAMSIRKRAGEIARPGEFIGWFEWLVWAHMHAYRPIVLLASNEIDVFEIFGAGLPQPVFTKDVLVAGVYASGFATMAATQFPLRLNHWMIGDKGKPAKIGERAWAKSAHVQAAKAGWRLRATAAQGDCGIDTMSFWEQRPRNEATWCDIRLEVAAAMASVATEAAWQDAFITCQESRTGGRAARAATAAAVRYPSGGAAFGSGAPPTPNVPAAAVPKLSMAVASGHPPAPREPPAPPQPLEPPQPPGPADRKLVKLEPTGEQHAAKEDAAPVMSSPAVASTAAGTTGPGIKEEPSSEAKSPSMPVCLPGTADDSGKDGKVDMHGGTLALARCAVDAENKPDTQALEIRRAEAMATATAPPRFLNGHMLETAFVTWIKQQSEEQQKAIMKSYDSMKLHEEQWVANIGVQEASAPQRRPRQRRVATSLGERLQMATAFGAWRATAGATSRSPLKEARVFLGKGVPLAPSRQGPLTGVPP